VSGTSPGTPPAEPTGCTPPGAQGLGAWHVPGAGADGEADHGRTGHGRPGDLHAQPATVLLRRHRPAVGQAGRAGVQRAGRGGQGHRSAAVHHRVRRAAGPRPADPRGVRRPGDLRRQRPRVVDRHAVAGHPVGQLLQRSPLPGGDLAARRGPDVEQEVAAARHDVGEVADQTRPVEQMGGVLHLVVAEGQADAAAVLPRGGGLVRQVQLVFTGPEVPVGVAPAVVDHAVRHRGVVVPEQLEQAQGPVVLAGVRPLDVVPQHVRPVAVDQVPHVEVRIRRVRRVHRPPFVHGGVRVERRQIGHVPVETAGVVHAEPQARGPGGAGEFADQIAARAPAHRVAAGGAGRVPQRDAVVVLGGRDDVAGAGPGEQRRPRRRVERVGLPRVEESVVRCVAVGLAVVGAGRAVVEPDRVEVPLGVRVVPEPDRVVDRPELAGGFSPRGHGVGAPVDEDAELGVAVPVGYGARQLMPISHCHPASIRRGAADLTAIFRPPSGSRGRRAVTCVGRTQDVYLHTSAEADTAVKVHVSTTESFVRRVLANRPGERQTEPDHPMSATRSAPARRAR
jgi:hypothetical protein